MKGKILLLATTVAATLGLGGIAQATECNDGGACGRLYPYEGSEVYAPQLYEGREVYVPPTVQDQQYQDWLLYNRDTPSPPE
jgi:hypothetical protein